MSKKQDQESRVKSDYHFFCLACNTLAFTSRRIFSNLAKDAARPKYCPVCGKDKLTVSEMG